MARAPDVLLFIVDRGRMGVKVSHAQGIHVTRVHSVCMAGMGERERRKQTYVVTASAKAIDGPASPPLVYGEAMAADCLLRIAITYK